MPRQRFASSLFVLLGLFANLTVAVSVLAEEQCARATARECDATDVGLLSCCIRDQIKSFLEDGDASSRQERLFGIADAVLDYEAMAKFALHNARIPGELSPEEWSAFVNASKLCLKKGPLDRFSQSARVRTISSISEAEVIRKTAMAATVSLELGFEDGSSPVLVNVIFAQSSGGWKVTKVFVRSGERESARSRYLLKSELQKIYRGEGNRRLDVEAARNWPQDDQCREEASPSGGLLR